VGITDPANEPDHARHDIWREHELVPGLLDHDALGDASQLLCNVLSDPCGQLVRCERCVRRLPGEHSRAGDGAANRTGAHREAMGDAVEVGVGTWLRPGELAPQFAARDRIGHWPLDADGRQLRADVDPAQARDQHDGTIAQVEVLCEQAHARVLAALPGCELIEPRDHRERAAQRGLAPERNERVVQDFGGRGKHRQIERDRRRVGGQRDRGPPPGKLGALQVERERLRAGEHGTDVRECALLVPVEQRAPRRWHDLG